jgi:predicted lipoprotein with Yx(FWY)xxD motif
MRNIWWAAAMAAGLLGLAGCGSDPAGSSAGSGSSSPAASNAVLSTTDSSIGTIVVDADGRTVYVFDKDTAGSGTSACSGDCVDDWPAVTADSDSPEVDGVTGDVGTIARDDGTRQVTLDGLPLYTYEHDSHAGDVNGQGVKGIWWVVGPDGSKISTTASPSQAPAIPGY